MVENILDYESLAQAWEEEVRKRSREDHSPVISEVTPVQSTGMSKKVFVVHGRDERLRIGTFTFLRSLKLEPIEWIEAIRLTGKASPHISEILSAAFGHAQAVVVLLTPDDEAKLRDELIKQSDGADERTLMGQARPNVLFEAGMAFASHENRTVLVQFGFVRSFSDIAGRHIVKMDNSVTKRHELAMKLKAAGCTVDVDGSDWQTNGDLTPRFEVDSRASALVESQPRNSASVSLEQRVGTGRVVIAPISRAMSDAEYNLEKIDEFGALIRLPNGTRIRVPKADYIESWDDGQDKRKLVLTRKYFQGYFPGHEHSPEYFLPHLTFAADPPFVPLERNSPRFLLPREQKCLRFLRIAACAAPYISLESCSV